MLPRMDKKVALCTTSAVAEHYGVHPATVRKWVADGVLKPAITTPGGHYRFADPSPIEPEGEE